MGIGLAKDETDEKFESDCPECGTKLPSVSYGFSRPELTSYAVGNRKMKECAEKIAKQRREWVQSLYDKRRCSKCGYCKAAIQGE